MVFEKVVVQLLDKYLSDYIENVDYKKLKIDMWSGNVVLENLSLKPNALADLNLPVIIKTGYLQKLRLQVPWKSLYTQPTKVTIDGLYVLVIPKIEVEYDAKREEEEQHQSKMKEVEQIEKLQSDKDDLENKKQTEQTNDTFSARMKLQILQNLELSIHNIHIVYEDKTTKPDHPFSFGITLNSITLHTTNKDWIPTIMKENTPVNYKLGELNALAIYWNTDVKPISKDIIKTLHATIAANDKQTPPHMSYIFRPFNVKAKLIMTLKPRQENFEKPMFHITIDLDHISLNLTRTQYLDMLDLLEYQDYMRTKLKYIKYRPKKFENSIEKWKFAYNAIVNEKIKVHLARYQWQNIKLHLNNCKEYRAIYYQELIGKATNEQRQRIEELERKLDVFYLIYNRRCAQIEVKKRKPEPTKFLGLFARRSNKKPNLIEQDLNLEKLMSEEEKKELYESIGYQGEDISTLTYPKEYIDIDLTVRLQLLNLNIWSKINENDRELNIISHASLPDTELIFRRRPATSSALFFISLGSFQVFGLSDQPDKVRPNLIQSLASNNAKLLQIEFAINPTDKDSGYRLRVISQSLEIKYHAPTINNLIQCFQKDSRHHLQGVKQVAYTTYADVKSRSILLMKNKVEQVNVMDIYIDLQSPYIILPENGIYYDGCPVICIDLGHLIFQQKKDKTLEDYTQFQLELKKIQLLYANKNENWRVDSQEENTRLHLIQPITLYTNIAKCNYPDHSELPAWKISGQIPEINMRISDMRLFQIMKHLQSFSFPQSKTTTNENTRTWSVTTTVQQTLETIDSITEEKPVELNSQDLVQIEANFELPKIDLILEEEKNSKEQPFLHISFVSICVQTLIKTYDIEFQASLDDLIIFHEQFITEDNSHLRILAAKHDENEIILKKLVTIHILHTSSENPLFTSSKYRGLENKIRIHLNKFIVTL